MNILFITQLFPFSKGDKNTTGALREFVEHWGNNGNSIHVIRLHFKHEREPFPPKTHFKIGENISVNFIQPVRIPVLKFTYYNNKKIIESLDFKPDIIICHHYNAYFTFYRIAQKLQIPLVLGLHMSDLRLSKNKFHKWHLKRIYKKVARFACRSQAYQNLFIQQFPEFSKKVFLALSGIPQKYLDLPLKTTPNSQRIKLVTAGMLIKRKQIDLILRGLAKLGSNVNWEFTIIGSGTEETSLQQLTIDLNIQSNVRFVGHQSRDYVFDAFRNSDIFILPSYDETLGLVYLEAMASGCITIGCINEGIDGIIIDGENGFLCNAHDPKSIESKIVEAINLNQTEKENMLRKSKATIAHFSVEEKANEYLTQLKKICNDYH